MSQALEILKQQFGYAEFRGQQAAVIQAAEAGKDCVVLMPTGGGKSICYQIPGLTRSGMALVISPLIALMEDQVSSLRQAGIRAEYLNSSLEFLQQQAIFQQVEQGNVDLLYVAPERLLMPSTLDRLAEIEISLIAIDEAHCVSQWGHDFRSDYLGLSKLRQVFPGVPRMALTATANQRTREEVARALELDDPAFFVDSFDRPNICYQVHPRHDSKKQLLQFLKLHPNEPGIVYCLSRKKVDETASWLSQSGFKALPYHAGHDAETRRNHQRQFLISENLIMVATIAFGMGIDKPDIRFVAHLDLPKSLEAYYQETGRAGRDQKPADAWMIYGLQDVVRLTEMVSASAADESFKRLEKTKLDALLGWCEISSCRRIALLDYFGENYPSPCGNCDVCLTPPDTWDGTEDAQKLLSCIVRTGQRFGAGHVIDVLRGRETDKVFNNQHHQLPTFGLGEDQSVAHWRSVLRQLMVGGYVYADADRYGVLTLTESCRPLLRGDMTLTLRTEPVVLKSKSRSRNNHHATALSGGEKALFESLKACRLRLAQENGVPPYVIFHDATLAQMVERQPQNASELMMISGVGETKLDRYGEAFLDIIRDFIAPSESEAL